MSPRARRLVRSTAEDSSDSATLGAVTRPPVDSLEDLPVQVSPSKTDLPRPRRSHVDRDGIPSIVQFVEGPEYLGLSISPAQRTLLKAIYGLPLEGEEPALWTACTGRETYARLLAHESPHFLEMRMQHTDCDGGALTIEPDLNRARLRCPPQRKDAANPHRQTVDELCLGGFSQVTVIAGRRSGKDSRIAAPIALYEAIYVPIQQPPEARITGESIIVPIVAMNEKGARIAFNLIAKYARRTRVNKWVHDETNTALEVENMHTHERIMVECFPCKAAALRGWSIPMAIMDEVGFFSSEAGLEKDAEIQVSIEGAGVHYPRQLIVKISTPGHRPAGLLYDDQRLYWAADTNEILVWKATTLTMNPFANAAKIARIRKRSPLTAMREYDAEFVTGDMMLFDVAHLEACVVPGRRELPPRPGVKYVFGIDPSGGLKDAWTLAGVHHENGRMVHDVMRAWRPTKGKALDLETVFAEIAAIMKRYGVYRAFGDRYAGEFPTQRFRPLGITYIVPERDKTQAYLALEPWVNTHQIDLLDEPNLLHEASLLERRAKWGGKRPLIDHAGKSGHDDYPNALAQAVAELAASLNIAVDMSGDDPEVVARRPQELDDHDRPIPHPAPGDGFTRGRGQVRFWSSQPSVLAERSAT